MLAACAVARKIGKRPVGGRNGRIFLFDAASHFRDQGFLERHSGGEGAIRISVLVFEMLPNPWVQQARVAHDPLPVGVLKPREFVGENDAMPTRLDRTGLRPWSSTRRDRPHRAGRTRSWAVGHCGKEPPLFGKNGS